MSSKSVIRIGVVGVGGMGGVHARSIRDGQVVGAVLSAVCDVVPRAMEGFGDVSRFTDSSEMIHSGKLDAVVVATPHYDHTPVAIEALEQGLHVLVEKPLAVHKADCEKMLAAHEKQRSNGVVFAEMFNQRTDPKYKKLKALIDGGELGELCRINWIITDWFRTEAYYRSGGWRATWRGEGGGVLLNQCPHQLDLFQWLFGMPRRVRAFCGFGRWHDIEVEDQVTAYMEYENGGSAVFISSTGEAPGTNRLEVAGERGKIVIEGSEFSFVRNEVPMSEFSRVSPERFATPPVWHVKIPVSGSASQHVGILKNFVQAIAGEAELVAPASDGIKSVELANAMLYSAIKAETLELPLDSAAYAALLDKLIGESRYQVPALSNAAAGDLDESFKS
jgi:predicted dehydrogenase